MSEDQKNAVIGRTSKEYQAAKRQLASLYAEAERFGYYLVGAGDVLRLRHNLWLGEHSGLAGDVDLSQWPTADHVRMLLTKSPKPKAKKAD